MINIEAKRAKVHIHWNVSPYDYSIEAQNRIISIASQKYGLNKESIKVIPEFKTKDDNGNEISLSTTTVNDIQNPSFQQKLFKDYLKHNEITDYNFDIIQKIDAEINGKIDYQAYEKFRRYAVKYIKFSNFLSYGENNLLDFSSFKNFVLITGEPANTSGKTTLAIDLLHFLLFGKTDKAATQDLIFNTHRPEATKVDVEGCISIDGEDYIIHRVLSRPTLDKRTSKSKTIQKVEYYKLVGENKELLEDCDNEDMKGEDSRHTNKIIKEAIGNENDFNLIMSITGSNLDDLIEKKDTERGRLLSRWIGLLPLEEKETKAKEKFNTEVKPNLKSNHYDQNTLNQENEAFTLTIKNLQEEIEWFKKANIVLDEEINNLESNRTTLLSSKRMINEEVLKLDITTLTTKMNTTIQEGNKKKENLQQVIASINGIGEVEFSHEVYDKLVESLTSWQVERTNCGNEWRNLQTEITSLEKGEYCPTCGRKYDNIDNSAKINEKKQLANEVEKKGKKVSILIENGTKQLESLKLSRAKVDEKNKLLMKKSALEAQIEQLRGNWIELNSKKQEYEKNKEAIDINNNLDIQINSVTAMLTGKRQAKDANTRSIQEKEYNINYYKQEIEKRNILIKEIIIELEVIKNWKIYLDMVGKNGISKMVLRKTLPIINARLNQLLDDVCDFNVEISLNNKNEAKFELLRDGKRRDLTSASGFERTCSALALRSALASVSTMPACNYITLDEVLDRVADENLDKAKTLLEKIATSYDFLLLVFHKNIIKEWCNTILTVGKKDNVSYIKTTKQ